MSTDKDAAKVDSSELLDASGRLVIYHRGEQYQLRQTRAEKLILTKLRPSD
ncbi:MAG: hemin uptake protein HemP [Pseudomonadota bacterium]